MNFVDELKWRGMIHDIMPGTEELLNKEKTSGYIGFDPTADSLHIGHMVQVMLLVHFQRAGHTPIALVGGATGMIGDPSGKSEERNLLDEASLRKNQDAIKKQLSQFLDFQSDKPNRALMVNNYDWMKEYSFPAVHKGYRKAYNCKLYDVERLGEEKDRFRIEGGNVIYRVFIPACSGNRFPSSL